MERPILFSGPMVRAILDGRKTVTRRIVNGAPGDAGLAVYGAACTAGDGGASPACAMFFDGPTVDGRGLGVVRCPLGSPGDHLWVRETWCLAHPDYHDTDKEAGDRPVKDGRFCFYAATDDVDTGNGSPWKPSIHMPRWASRLTLEVVGVRVERLQEITEEDAIAEGAQRFDDLSSTHPYGQDARWSMESPTATDQCLGSARMAFANLWDKLNASRAPWLNDPWVWRVEFRVVQP